MKHSSKKAVVVLVVGAKLLGAAVGNAVAGPEDLALRCETGACIYHGSTTQTIETSFGTNLAALAFEGTTTYDFYSPPLAAATALTTKDKAAGTIVMENTSTSNADDFTVKGRMQYFDYDPATGAETLIVDTTDSGTQDVQHGEKMNCNLPKVNLAVDHTVPASHLLHIAVTVTLVSGNPGNYGHLLYNGARGSSTAGQLHQNNAARWAFAQPGTATVLLCKPPGGCASLTCSGIPNSTYLIQATTNLAAPTWTTIATATAGSNGLFNFTDPDSTNYPCRFYRTSTP
jgi:hypothetical protein